RSKPGNEQTPCDGRKRLRENQPCADAVTARVAACALELGGAGGAGERDDVADVFHAGDVHEQAFEAEAEAGVGDGAEAPEIEVPGVGGLVETVRPDLFAEHVEALFALAAADDLADAR